MRLSATVLRYIIRWEVIPRLHVNVKVRPNAKLHSIVIHLPARSSGSRDPLAELGVVPCHVLDRYCCPKLWLHYCLAACSSTLRYATLRDATRWCATMRSDALRCATMRYDALQYSSILHFSSIWFVLSCSIPYTVPRYIVWCNSI